MTISKVHDTATCSVDRYLDQGDAIGTRLHLPDPPYLKRLDRVGCKLAAPFQPRPRPPCTCMPYPCLQWL